MRDSSYHSAHGISLRSEHQPKLGTGQRFKNLKKKLSAKGAKDPAALAAYIGRKKYGNKKFSSLSKHVKGR